MTWGIGRRTPSLCTISYHYYNQVLLSHLDISDRAIDDLMCKLAFEKGDNILACMSVPLVFKFT